MKKKVFAALLVASVGVVSLGGTTAVYASEDKPYVIEINPLISLAVFANSDEGIQAAADDLGFDLKILGCTELTDTAAYEMFHPEPSRRGFLRHFQPGKVPRRSCRICRK